MTGIRVLYSFPHKIGGTRIGATAWHQVAGVTEAGVEVLAFPAAVHTPLPASIRVSPTLARGRFRIPYRAIGSMRAFALHDTIVARRLPSLAASLDVVHVWPLAARRTLVEAARLGIPTVLERPNTHTRYAYEVVRGESERLGVTLPPGQEHAYNEQRLGIEEEEYRLADYLLCPSDFVVETFLAEGFAREKLVRHCYGYDESRFFPDDRSPNTDGGLTVLFAGLAAVRKGLHFALEAWLGSPASRDGTFMIAGEILPGYAEYLAPMLAERSVRVLGQRDDIPELMRSCDVLVLPSIEEGSALVCNEAIGSGCVPLVSRVSSSACRHMENALVHPVGDVAMLQQHITMLHDDRALLTRLREGALASAPRLTWAAAGVVLADVYREVAAPPGSVRLTVGAVS